MCAGVVCAGEEARLTSTMKSDVALCDDSFKQKDYLPVIYVCIVYNLLKARISLHISLVATAGSNRGSVS